MILLVKGKRLGGKGLILGITTPRETSIVRTAQGGKYESYNFSKLPSVFRFSEQTLLIPPSGWLQDLCLVVCCVGRVEIQIDI